MRADYEIPEWLSDESVDLLDNVLNTDPETRYSAEEIKEHPWFNQVKPRQMTAYE